ncbi:MAG: hypothetical protein WC100_00935 [Sterolibacterium sp.]
MSADFLLVRPLAITDALLTSSNVYEAPTTEYAGGTTYAAGDIRGTTTGTAQLIYKSLQTGNVGHTQASSPTWWQYLCTVYAAYAGGTTYALGDIVSSISTNVHLLYESQIAGNVGNALTDTTKWLSLGATNRRKMFDEAYNSQTENADTIAVVITPGQIINTLSALNVAGASITVTQATSGWTVTESLASHPVLSWYDWFYEDVLRAGDITITGIPPLNYALTITIDNTGDTAKCGCLIPGKSRVLGTTDIDLTRTINDYSVAVEDSDGNVTLNQRAYSKRMNIDVQITPGFESEVTRLLEAYRATPVVFVGSTTYAMTSIYGFLGNWEVPLSLSGKLAHIEIKGLI